MYDIILSFITAFTLTYFAIPSIINIARVKNLCDEPGERRSHTVSTPSLAGIAIFAGVIFSMVLWTPFNLFVDLQYILCAFIIIFLIGAKDDILPMAPNKKLIGQILASAILVFKSNVVITSLYGILGIWELPEYLSIILSIFAILVIINAFNLIDGINGLSASIGALIAIILGFWFCLVDCMELAIIAFALTGALIAFLKYNFTPAKIFMGDTGAMLVGIICATLAIKFIELNELILHSTPGTEKYKFIDYSFNQGVIVAIGIMILPLFDTLRVFITRVLRGRSPFYPDRTHIHHLLIDFGFSHMKATGILVVVNVAFIILAFTLDEVGRLDALYLLLIILGTASFLTAGLYYSVQKKRLKTI